MVKTEVWKWNKNNEKEATFYCEAIPLPIAETGGVECILAAEGCGAGLGISYYLRKDEDHSMSEVLLSEVGTSKIHGGMVYLYRVEFLQ